MKSAWDQPRAAKQGLSHLPVWERAELLLEKAGNSAYPLCPWSQGWGIYAKWNQFSTGPSRRGKAQSGELCRTGSRLLAENETDQPRRRASIRQGCVLRPILEGLGVLLRPGLLSLPSSYMPLAIVQVGKGVRGRGRGHTPFNPAQLMYHIPLTSSNFNG